MAGNERALRWGIIGTGLIAGDFCLALRTFSQEEHKIVAVAARQLKDAEAFAKKHNIPKAYESYDSIASDPDIDIAYIGVIHPFHAEWSVKMLTAGKHVLCEKPMTMSAADTRRVLDVARKSQKLFLEGFWSRFFPVYDHLRKELAEKSIGDVTGVVVHFGKNLSKRESVHQKEWGGGVSLILGCYAAQIATLVFSGEKPEKTHVHGFLYPTGVDKKYSATLMYKDDKIAQFYIAGDSWLANKAFIYGTTGTIEVPMFWCPTEIHTPSGTVKFDDLPKTAEPTHFENGGGFAYEIRAVKEAIRNGLTEVPLMPHSDSLTISEITDEVLHQLGVEHNH